ncbi:MAG: tetratricopeptide repeat protein [bacterium]
MNHWLHKLPFLKKEAEFETARGYYICGKYQEAGKIFERFVARPKKYGLYYNLALYYLRQIHLNLASGYIHGAFYEKAIGELKKIEEINPHYADVHFQLGNCYAYLSMFEKAISEFEMALYINPKYHEARTKLALIFAKTHQYNNSINAYKQILKEHPDFSDIHFNLGIVYGMNREYAKGVRELETTQTLNPQYPLLDNALAIMRKGLASKADEKTHLEIKEQLNNHLIILLGFGEKYSYQVELPEGYNLWDYLIDLYKKVQMVHPEYSDVFYHIGLFYERKGEYDKAAGSFREALKLNPDYIEAQIALSLCLRRIGDLQGGIVQLEDVIRRRPHYADLYSHLASIYSEMGKTEKAIDCFKLALKRNPHYNDSRAGLAILYEQKGMIKEAILQWEDYAQLLEKGQWQENVKSHIIRLKEDE